MGKFFLIPRGMSMPLARLTSFFTLLAMAMGTAFGADQGAGTGASSDSGCKAGNQTLFYSPHPLLDARTAPGFSDSVLSQLRDPVLELGYCLEEVKDPRSILDTAKLGENLILQTLVPDESPGMVLVASLRVRELALGKLAEAISRPLVSLRFGPDEAQGLPNILARKIHENLRSQYVADLVIRSHPPGAYVRTPNGMEGRTPVEWLMPLGNMSVALEKSGYLPLRRDMDLSSPGQHTYDLQMVKRRFYHSGFIYPALAAGALSAVSFALENHYYSRYQALGAADQNNRPEAFGDTFHTAKSYERLAYTAMGLAWLNLVLCFTF
jgi:hypothetical protein